VQYQIIKIVTGGDGVATPLSNAAPLPISDAGGPKPLIAPDSDPGAVWFFPKFNPSEHNQNIWFAAGFEVLMNYDWRAG